MAQRIVDKSVRHNILFLKGEFSGVGEGSQSLAYDLNLLKPVDMLVYLAFFGGPIKWDFIVFKQCY